MKPLFLYLKSAKPHSDTLKKIREAGYVPIGVNSMDEVKIVEPLPMGLGKLVSEKALSLLVTGYQSDQAKLGVMVAKYFLNKE